MAYSEQRTANSRKPLAVSREPIRVAVTGGHHTPAVAVIEALRKKRGDLKFSWIGHRYSLRGEKTESAEYRTVKELGIPFFDLKAGKLYKVRSLKELLRIPLGFFHALQLLIKIKPRLIISFGGYLAAPVVLAGFILRIPVVTHEQTVVSGWANRFIGYFAKKIFVSWKRSFEFFPKEKTVLTGNPIRETVFEARTDRFKFSDRLPIPSGTRKKVPERQRRVLTIYVTGGKQGAHVINEAIRAALSEFLKRYNVIHQTGSSEKFRDYQKIMILRSQLPEELARRHIVQEYFGEEEIGAVFKAVDLVVSRSGANIVTELVALGKPAILVPIPWSSHNEQMENAKMLKEAGLVEIIPEEELSPERLLQELEKMTKDLERYRKGGKEAKKLVDLSAAEKIADEVLKLLSS